MVPVFRRSSAEPLFKRKSINNFRTLSLGDNASFPPLTPDDTSSSHQLEFTQTSLEFNIPDSTIAQDGAESGGCSIDVNDIVIAIMGLTGAGKSSFVCKATGNSETMIGHDLASRTRTVQAVKCTHPDGARNIVLVDTPGFDDTRLSDAQILRTIADWLKETYQNNIRLAGILYLHRISDVRMAGTPLRNLTIFKDLCGNDNLRNIVLVTTMWDEMESHEVGSEREKELVSNFWKDMILLGSRSCRYQGTRESAWEIISQLDLEACRQRRAPLQIQREMVDRGLPLHDTTAGKTLLRSLGDEFKKVWAKIRGKARRPTSPSLRRSILRRSSIRSNSSSLADSASISSRTSTRPSSIASSTSSCSSLGRGEVLSAMVRGLKIAREAAELVPVPILRGAIGTVLSIAELLEEMNGVHHAISQVIENSGWLLEEITQFARKSQLSEDMKKLLVSFQRELKHIKHIVKKFQSRSPVARFLLHDADIQVISQCNSCIKAVYDKLGLKLAMENYSAITSFQEELTFLRNNRESRECQCGSWVVREENEEFFDATSQASVS